MSESTFSIRVPFNLSSLKGIDKNVTQVQTNQRLTDAEFEVLGKALSDHPNMTLRIFGWNTVEDIEFLRYFPNLKGFKIDCASLKNLDGLRHLPADLDLLVLPETLKPLNIEIISRFQALQTLFLNGKHKRTEVVGELTSLRKLALSSNAIRDISILRGLSSLQVLELRLGSAIDLSPLPEIGKLRYLEIWMMRGLEEISPIGDMKTLRYLFLQDLPRVTRLPNMELMLSLERVHLEHLRGLTSLDELASAPALKTLGLVDMRQVTVDTVRPLKRSKTLEFFSAGTGSVRRNEAIVKFIGLPDVGFPDWKELLRD